MLWVNTDDSDDDDFFAVIKERKAKINASNLLHSPTVVDNTTRGYFTICDDDCNQSNKLFELGNAGIAEVSSPNPPHNPTVVNNKKIKHSNRNHWLNIGIDWSDSDSDNDDSNNVHSKYVHSKNHSDFDKSDKSDQSFNCPNHVFVEYILLQRKLQHCINYNSD